MAKTALDITEKEMAVYRATARQQAEQERHALQQRTQRARDIAHSAAALLKEQFGAKRVLLFGSLARDEAAHHRSDIDLAVEGIPAQDFWGAWAALDELGPEFEIDLIDLETSPLRLQLKIEQEGILL